MLNMVLLMPELDDAKGIWRRSMREMTDDPEYCEVNLRIDLGHIYARFCSGMRARIISAARV